MMSMFICLIVPDMSVSNQVSGPARLFTDCSSGGLEPSYKAVTKCTGIEFLGLASRDSQTVAKRGYRAGSQAI